MHYLEHNWFMSASQADGFQLGVNRGSMARGHCLLGTARRRPLAGGGSCAAVVVRVRSSSPGCRRCLLPVPLCYRRWWVSWWSRAGSMTTPTWVRTGPLLLRHRRGHG